ncbi:MAG TPA: hypothetical protein VHO24_17525 [Opitutaceae bacterium]|nr:hypothetical protein [Opitutaceae bacterium]
MKLLAILVFVLSLSGCASNPWSRQFGTKAKIEQTLAGRLPIGSSREEILGFFKERNIHVMELKPGSKKPEHTLTVCFPVSWLMVPQQNVLISFHLGPDGRSIKMIATEADAGFL